MRYFLSFISFLISVLLIEVYLNVINYPYQGCKEIINSSESYLGEFSEDAGWKYKQSFSYYDGNGRYQYNFDEDGIRSSEPNCKITHIKPIIIFIGDFVTFGEKLNYNDTFASKINELLGDKFEVVNLGVQGYGSVQSMVRLQNIISLIKPEYVVYTFIPDHINRNINYDRRLQAKCLQFSGTKPVFTVRNDRLIQIRSPHTYDYTDKYKSLLFLNLSYQAFNEKWLLKNNKAVGITKKLVEEISEISSQNNAKDYYIYYDIIFDKSPESWNEYLLNTIFLDKKDKVLNFTNWAVDSKTMGTKYYVDSDDDYHPNASLSAEIAKRFVEKFNADLLENN